MTVNDIVPEWSATPDRTNTYVVPPGGTARLRIINTSSFAQFYVFASDGRQFQVIELDGVKVTPRSSPGFSIASGQRVSVLFTGNGQAAARIYFISEPQVAGGTTSLSINDQCRARPSDLDDVGAVAQFTQLYINNQDGNVTNVVNLNDFDKTHVDGSVERRRFLKMWSSCTDN